MTEPTVGRNKISVRPIVKRKLSEQVLDILKEMILSGELSPGDAMPSERALMQQFGVGRPAVREALQSLANMGLITISHGERSRVNELNAEIALRQVDEFAKMILSVDPENLKYLKQLRNLLEAGTVDLALDKGVSDDDVRELRELVEKQRDSQDDAKAFIRTDIAFHVRIAKITRNPLLQAVTQAMLSWLFEYYRPLLHWSGRESTTLQEHIRIIDLLESQDRMGAKKMMLDHLNRSASLYTNETSS